MHNADFTLGDLVAWNHYLGEIVGIVVQTDAVAGLRSKIWITILGHRRGDSTPQQFTLIPECLTLISAFGCHA